MTLASYGDSDCNERHNSHQKKKEEKTCVTQQSPEEKGGEKM
jgi:hypothetical protein